MKSIHDKVRKVGQEVEYTPEMINEVVKCKEDVIYFAEHYYYIVTIDEGRQLIKLRDYQKKMLKAFVNPPHKKQHCIVLSSRQIGKTVVTSIFILWYALFQRDKTVAMLADKEKTSNDNLKKLKFAYQELPLFLQQGIEKDGWNASSLILENGSKIVAASTASTSIRGQSVSLLFLDEFAFVPDHAADDFMASVYPTIASGKTSKIIMVSTPRGMNHFYRIWKKALEGKDDPTGQRGNNFYPIKINWYEVPGRDQNFKKTIIRDFGIVKWNSEFAAKFVGSISTLIDSDILEDIQTLDPIATKWSGMLLVYELPQPNATYVIGVDVATGIKKDYSVIQVLKINSAHNIEEVAIYRNNEITPRDFAQIVIAISDYYNHSHIMVESNGAGDTLCDIIWYTYECDRLINCDAKGLGIRSTKKSKLLANVLLKDYMEKEWIKLKDARTVYELSRYEEITPDVFSCPAGENDDCVTSLLWGLYFVKTDAYEGRVEDDAGNTNNYKIDNNNLDKYNSDDGPAFVFD